jgi:DNA-binding protein YbaB
MERPQWSALQGMMQELNRSLDNIKDTQQQILELTATAWSDDRLIKVTVGPRGQLVDLDLDPRVFRNPNSKALSASILAAVREAVEDVNQRIREIVEKATPKDPGFGFGPQTGLNEVLRSHDADLPAILKKEDGDGYLS